MKKGTYFLLITLAIISCKSEIKSEITNNKALETDESKSEYDIEMFEKSLLDYRDINKSFLDNYKVEKFGIQKQGDSLISFVFKLNDSTTRETVESYSLAIRGFDRTLDKPLLLSFEPILTEIQGAKYIVATRVIKKTRYFDSISAYIYKRKDWKGSGRLGGFKIIDVLFEDKKTN